VRRYCLILRAYLKSSECEGAAPRAPQFLAGHGHFVAVTGQKKDALEGFVPPNHPFQTSSKLLNVPATLMR
jgi:hypothetical protein